MNGEMKRGRSQVIWRYTPGASFRYNDSGPWCQATSVVLRDVASLKGPLATALTQTLARWRAIGATGYPDPETQASQYEVGEPYQVEYSLWPTVFQCPGCRKVYWYKDIDRLRSINDRVRCSRCRRSLRQVQYAYVCECGRIEPVYIPKHDPKHKIVLEDRGSFRDSSWRCEDCGQALMRDSKSDSVFGAAIAPPRGQAGHSSRGQSSLLLTDAHYG